MRIESIRDQSFEPYGRPVGGYDFAPLLAVLSEKTPKPADRTVYVPSDAALEALPVFDELSGRLYGGMPIQIGFCNGGNRVLNCLEYHRGSEVDVAADDIVLLLAPLAELRGGTLDTSLVEAFAVPAGTAVQLYETTLHYAPCRAPGSAGFRTAVVLPRGTNTEIPRRTPSGEDRLLWARNKWLVAHPDAPEAARGAYIGLTGENPTVK